MRRFREKCYEFESKYSQFSVFGPSLTILLLKERIVKTINDEIAGMNVSLRVSGDNIILTFPGESKPFFLIQMNPCSDEEQLMLLELS